MQSYDGYFLCLSVWHLAAIGIEPRFALPKSAEVVEVIVAGSFLGNFVAGYF